MTAPKKKLIEVALPLDAINEGCRQEKNPFIKGHPKSIHLWWARRPLAACRAVLFATIVDDPSSHPDKFPTKEDQQKERERLFNIIRELVKWENTNNERVLNQARDEILKATDGNPPPVLDPFCGGGSIPLEAQRLGLEAYASDLNPVAVLITKALIEIPPKFAGQPPVHPDDKGQTKAVQTWKGAQGLAEDVRYYGQWMCDEAENHIGHLYPKVKITSEMVADRPDLKQYLGHDLTVIAWLWARTVTCPNPACKAEMPLVRSFSLSTKKGKRAWVEPIVGDSPFAEAQKALPGMDSPQGTLDSVRPEVRFTVRTEEGQVPESTVNRRGARCFCCNTPVPFDHVRREGREHRMGAQLMAIVAEGQWGRVYLPPNKEHVSAAVSAEPENVPDTDLPEKALGFRIQRYGMTKHCHLFTPRQLVALTTFSDLIGEAREKVLADAKTVGMVDDSIGIADSGTGAQAYADAVILYLTFGISHLSRYLSTLCPWNTTNQNIVQVFGRQALPMVWDYAEGNPIHGPLEFNNTVRWVIDALSPLPARGKCEVSQFDAVATTFELDVQGLYCTDPPYYDNIGYADISDFFFVWLRPALKDLFPNLFSTLLTPKSTELVATPHRFEGDSQRAESFFREGFRGAFERMRPVQSKSYPLTMFYAFKQQESKTGASVTDVYSTGWETMLEGLIDSGYQITGTWPLKTEKVDALKRKVGALASSIVLACRPRPSGAGITTRRDFSRLLKAEMPSALATLQKGNIAPVDMAQAAIGPGIAVFSRYSKVLEPNGDRMTVRTALEIINRTLDEVLAEHESEYDADTRWALAWYEQYGHDTEDYGVAEVLSKAKDTSVEGLVQAGILEARGGKVRLLPRVELNPTWDPTTDKRMPVWEVTQHLCHALATGGEEAAAEIAGKVGALGEVARDLAYRLYTLCERKGWAQEALAYNSLVIAWPEIQRRVQAGTGGTQTELGL